jgi:crotonobetainyl-CoA:carnitine CoA-transferase CaiB-like acyl-CoA transferase
VQEVEHPHYGRVKVVGPPATFSESAVGVQSPPPLLGEHNQEILTRLLCYSEGDVQSFRDQGVI